MNANKQRVGYAVALLLAGVLSLSIYAMPRGKGYKGHPVTFDPASLLVELALNGAGRQTISFMSQETLDDVTVWIVPEISPFVSAGAYELGTLEAGWGYELDLDFITPEDAVPGYYEGTIHLRVGNRTVAKPLPVTIKILDEWVSLSDWPYRRCDLAGSSCNPYGSTVFAGSSLTNRFNVQGTDGYVLAGDVDGDWETEIITVSGNTLNIYSGTGELEQSIVLPRDCQLSMLEDADGDGVLDIGLGSRGDGFDGYIYKADGTLLKTLSGSHGGWYGDHSMIPLTISKGKVLVGYNAGYSRTPRGVASFDYVTGAEEWYYQVGPANGWYSLPDMDGNGILDITMNSHTVHNGASGNGTTDGDIYLVVLDENGAASLSQKYPSPSNGWAMHMFADMDGDGMQEILGFEGHDPRYYPGQAQIHIYGQAGETLHTFNGPANVGWDYAVGDLDGDGVPEVVVSARTANQVYVLDNKLQLLSSQAIEGNVKLICDLTGDGYKEIVLLTTDGMLKVLDSSLALIAEVQCGTKNGNVIASDVDGNGIVELLVQTDQLYVLSFAKDTMSANETSYESVPVVDILSVPAIVESDEAGANVTNDKERPIVIESQPEAADRYKLIRGEYTWHEAKADAETRGGHLVTVTSSEEWKIICSLFDADFRQMIVWLGATDEKEEGVWKWVTGEPFTFNAWNPGEPNNDYDGAEDYLHVFRYDDFVPSKSWNDCVEDHYIADGYVMEIEQNDLEPDGTFTGIESWDPAAQPSSRYIKIADSQDDFSGAQGNNGWYYGYSDEGGFQEFPDFDGSSWGISTSYWTSIWRDGTHPNSTTTSGGKVPENHTTIRRWICAEGGEYQIKGTLEESGVHPAADGVTVTIAGHVYELNEGDPAIEFQFNTYLDAGDIVDIELAPNLNDFTDGTYIKIEIYRLGVAEPEHGEAVEADAQSDLSDSQAVDDRIEPLIQPDPAASLDISIQGVWELLFDDGSVRYKTIGNGKWLVEQRDLETGEMVYRHGGSYTLHGNSYVETVEYANKSTEHLIGNTYEFNVSVEGDTLHQMGIDNPWTEDWRWISGSTTSPDQVETDSLQQNAETKFKIYGLLCCANRPDEELKLNAIYWNPTDPLVTINAENYRVGDTVNGYTIVEIRKTEIVFRNPLGEKIVKFFYDYLGDL